MNICVIGTGTMAKGIVKAFAAKMPVVMKSRTQESLDKAMASISKGYNKLVEKGKITEDAMKAILGNITTTTDYATFADADLVIEAAVENMQLKKDVFMELDKICKPETIFATNSSSLSITEIAASYNAYLRRFLPLWLMRLSPLCFPESFETMAYPASFCSCFGLSKRRMSPTSATKQLTVFIPTPLISSSLSIYGISDSFFSISTISSSIRLLYTS